MKSANRKDPQLRQGGALRLKTRQSMKAYLWIAPAILLTCVFTYYAFFRSVFQSFFLVNAKGQNGSFAGLRNYIRIFSDLEFRAAIVTTLRFAVITVPVSLALALALALLAGKKRKLSPIYESMFTLPMAMSTSVVVMIFQFMLNPSLGVINRWFGLNISWFYDTKYLLPTLIVMQVWMNLGFDFIYYLSAIRSVPADLLESAEMDGASQWMRIRKIVLPMISPTTFFLLCTETAKSMMISAPLIIIQTALGNSTTSSELKTVIYYMYNSAFQRNNYSYAYAAAAVGFILTFLVMPLSFRFEKKGVYYA